MILVYLVSIYIKQKFEKESKKNVCIKIVAITRICSYFLCFEKKLLRHLIKCGKSEKNQRRRFFVSIMGGTLGFSSVTLNKFHIDLFEDSPSHVMLSTFNPAPSAMEIAFVKIWCNTVLVALHLLKKQPNVWTHFPSKDWNIITKAWSPFTPIWCFGVYFPRLVKPSIFKFGPLKDNVAESFISSISTIPMKIKF